MRLESLSPRTRSVVRVSWVLVVGAFWFVLLPAGAESLSDHFGWPRWQHGVLRLLGALILATGLALLLWCSRLFVHVGGGSIVPIDEPNRLVASGPYQHSRNPVYIAYVGILVGLFLLKGRLGLLVYAGLFALFFHAVVVFWEEPHLQRQFGEQWMEYSRRVPRWFRLPRWRARRAAISGWS